MFRRTPADPRTRDALPCANVVLRVATAVVVALVVASLLPGATSAALTPSEPDPRLLYALRADNPLTLVPFVPVTAPATGGQTLSSQERADLTDRLDPLAETHAFGLALQDLRTGATYSYNAHEQFPTASVAKLTIITMLVMRAEEEDRELTPGELAQAEQMIRFSDNEVTDELYARIGFTEGFEEGAEALGLTGTDPNSRGVWGSTMTTAADQVRLLRALYVGEGPISEEGSAYIRDLMETVAPEQGWGISAAAEEGDLVGLKNGWTPRESNGGLWTTASVGYVVGPDREYLIAVLSDHNADYVSGVTLLEELVGTVTDALERTTPYTDVRSS